MSGRARALSAALVAVLVTGLLVAVSGTAGAVTCTDGGPKKWVGPATNGDWNDGNDWMPTGAPTASDIVVVPGSVTFSSPVTGTVAGLLLCSAASFGAALDLDVTGDLT